MGKFPSHEMAQHVIARGFFETPMSCFQVGERDDVAGFVGTEHLK
jgi:hypothetical protein